MTETNDKIIYMLIAKDDKPLCEYSNYTGTFNQICLNYIKNIQTNSSKALKVDDFMIFYMNERNITFMIMTGKSYPKEGALGCLESIKREFNSTYEGRDFNGELNFGLNDEFSEKLKLKFDYFNEHKDITDDKIDQLKNQMSLMKDEIINSSGLLDNREDKLKVLDDKADILSRDSNTYYMQSKRVRRAELIKKIKLYAGIGVACLIIIYLIISIICGFTFKKCSS